MVVGGIILKDPDLPVILLQILFGLCDWIIIYP